MSDKLFFVLLLLSALLLYLLIHVRAGRRQPPPPVRHLKRKSGGSAPSSSKDTPPEAEPEKQAPVEELASPDGWRPMSRAQIEMETLWRLEHILRDLPDIGGTPIVQMDYRMEPRELAVLLGSNPFYAAKIIKTVNSAAFGLRYPIDSLQRAITYLGYNQVKNIIFQHTIKDSLARIGSVEGGMDLFKFWEHSHAVSVCAEFILRNMLEQTQQAGVITTAALLHDIGWIVYDYYDPGLAGQLQEKLGQGSATSNPVIGEEELFGFNHLVGGQMLAEHWKISPQVCNCIGLHHSGSFGYAEGTDRKALFGALVISLAENMAARLGFPHPLAEPTALMDGIGKLLGPGVERAKESPPQLREELERTMKFIKLFYRV